jgi:tetratricopeptide (TPR) repeat protein
MKELRAQFWEVMKSVCDGSKFQDVTSIPPENLRNKFQLFELLVVESLNRLDPAHEWRVTQVSGDKGVDFRGAGPRCEFGILNLTIQQTLIGQTKRRAAKNVGLFDDDLKKVGKLALTENIAGVVFVFSSEALSAEALYEHFRDPDNSIHFRGAKYFVDARRFEDFWARDRAHVLKMLDRCLSGEQKRTVENYLGSIAHTSQVELSAEVNCDPVGRTGKRFRCRLKLSQRVPLPNLKVRLRYKPSPMEAGRIEVLLPSRLAGPGQELFLSGDGVTEFEFFLRCFIAGRHHLGSIRVETETGVSIVSVDLGGREFLRTFEPPYFEKPNRSLHRAATNHLGMAAGGEVHALAILGAGGAGKSRFCEAVIEEAADLGFDWLSIGHDNSIKARRRLIRRLMADLLPARTTGSPFEQTLHWLRGRLSPFDESHERTLQTYFEDDSEAVAADVVTATLLTLIIERTRYKPLFIHLRDLHWADGETLSILGNTIDALRDACPTSLGTLFLLEGRDRDSLRLQTGLFRPPEDWLAFLNARIFERLEVQPWTAEQSRDFLLDMVEAARNPSQGAPSQRLPLFEQLCEHILSASSGNPMHIIEQLKSLIDRDYVEVTDAGTIYLKRSLPHDWQPARTVEDLIRLRLEFLKSRSPLAAELLVVMAKIGPRVPGALFRFVRDQAGGGEHDLSELYRVDMAVVPRHDGESLEFRHENYYHVCRNAEIRGDAPHLSAAIAFYQRQRRLTAKQEFEAAFLMAHHERPDYEEMLRHAADGLEEAKQAGDNLLCLDFCKFLLNLPENIMSEGGLDPAEIKLEQGARQIFSGNWAESLESLKQAESMLARRPLTEAVVTRRLSCKVDAVDALVTLMRTDEALSEVEDGLQLVARALSLLDERGGKFERELIEARDRLWLRQAVTYWFDGDILEAAKWQRRAYASGRAQRNDLTTGEALREFGTLVLHRHPLFGRSVLGRALERLGGERRHQATILARVEMLFADLLLAAWVDEGAGSLVEIRERAARLHYLCQEKASLYEAALVALAAGACCALDRDLEDAHHWFRLAVATAMRTSAYEEVWKGRLNLGQVCLELNLPAEASVHATEAAETLLVGLDSGRWARRASRRAMLTWPLLQCIRVAPELEGRLSRYLTCEVAAAKEQWHRRPPATTKSGRTTQVLHVRRGNSDFYLHT